MAEPVALSEAGSGTAGLAVSLRDGIGAMTDARIASFFDKMSRASVVKRDIDYRKAYTLQFVNKGIGLNLRPKK